MSLVEKITKERITALKSKDSVKLKILSTLLGEVQTKAKRSGSIIDDGLIIQTCKKFIEANNDVIKVSGVTNKIKAENVILESFLPKQLTDEELKYIVATCGAIDIKEAMAYLKKKHPGQYNGRDAARIVRAVL